MKINFNVCLTSKIIELNEYYFSSSPAVMEPCKRPQCLIHLYVYDGKGSKLEEYDMMLNSQPGPSLLMQLLTIFFRERLISFGLFTAVCSLLYILIQYQHTYNQTVYRKCTPLINCK